MVAVPSPLSAKWTPGGNAPVLEIRGSGYPLVVTVKPNTSPNVAAAAGSLVMTGADAAVVTLRVNAWAAGLPNPLAAVIVTG
jgi:hypothetical protein